ncbi:hypothetical protein BDW60DRAFT_196207 [Aspergillus nidulans var. acristatus]
MSPSSFSVPLCFFFSLFDINPMPVADVTEGNLWAPTPTFSFCLPFVTMCAYTGLAWACA